MSSNKDDLGYDAWARAGRRAKVFLDDVEQHDCITADEESGLVVRCKLNERGEIYAIGDEIAEEEVRGTVRIEVETSQ